MIGEESELVFKSNSRVILGRVLLVWCTKPPGPVSASRTVPPNEIPQTSEKLDFGMFSDFGCSENRNSRVVVFFLTKSI